MSAPEGTVVILDDGMYDTAHNDLMQGQPFVMHVLGDGSHLMVAIREGVMFGLMNGERVQLIKTSKINFTDKEAPDNHIKIDFLMLKGNKEHSHAYLDSLVTLAHAEGFPLAYIDFFPPERHVNDVSLTDFKTIIDNLRVSVNNGVWLK